MSNVESMTDEMKTGDVMPSAEVTSETKNAAASPERAMKFDATDIADNKYVAALSYLGILFLVPLLLKKDSRFAQFHAKQGLVMMIAFCIGSFIFWIPLVGWLLGLALFVVDIIALFRTLSGEAWEIPGVNDVVQKLNI